MRVHLLGSAAGGGLPQWNCSCRNCNAARRAEAETGGAGTTASGVAPRTQSSIAVSPDGDRWILINASPDIRTQLATNPEFWPDGPGIREARIAGVVLTDAQIDHTLGLLILREGGRLPLYATASVHRDLATAFPIIPVLAHYCGIDWHEIPTNGSTDGPMVRSEFRVERMPEIEFTASPLRGRPPPFSPAREDPNAHVNGDNIALTIRDRASGRTVFHAPGLAALDESLIERMAEADCLLIDGTFWTEDEMIRTGAGRKRAAEMGHLPLAGESGLLHVLERLDRPAKYLIHVNNTNPILDAGSAERAALRSAGVAVAHDGMAIEV